MGNIVTVQKVRCRGGQYYNLTVGNSVRRNHSVRCNHGNLPLCRDALLISTTNGGTVALLLALAAFTASMKSLFLNLPSLAFACDRARAI